MGTPGWPPMASRRISPPDVRPGADAPVLTPGLACRWRLVVMIGLWPSDATTTWIGAPLSSACEALQWRSQCGVTFRPAAATPAAFRPMVETCFAPSGVPRRMRNTGASGSGEPSGRCCPGASASAVPGTGTPNRAGVGSAGRRRSIAFDASCI